MPSTKYFNFPVLFTVFAVFSIYLLFREDLPPITSPPPAMANHDDDILAGLHVSLRQTSKSPPTISVKVTNNSPKAVTFLTWQSPLDQLALQIGLLNITPEGASEPLALPIIKAQRKLPPNEESLVSLAPGESKENDVVLKEVIVPIEKIRGKKTAVELKSRWHTVWLKARSDLTDEEIANLGDGGAAISGEVEAQRIEIEAE